MKTPHKHAALIHAWAEGAEIECYSPASKKWVEVIEAPAWDQLYQYRIKPNSNIYMIYSRFISFNEDDLQMTFLDKDHNVQFEFDENDNLVKVELI